MKKLIIPVAILILFTLTGCEAISDFFGLGGKATRPDFPDLASYIAAVPTKSEELVVESVVPTNFLPAVLKAKNGDGNSIFDYSANPNDAERILLMNNGNLVAAPSHTDHPDADFQPLVEPPQLQLVRYWVLHDGPFYYPGGTTTSKTVTFTHGTSSTDTYSFTESLSVAVSASVDAVVASASTTITAEFSATQEFESTFERTDTTEDTFTVVAEQGTNIVFVTWQLYEEYRFVNGEGEVDEEGNCVYFEDPSYVFTEESLRYVYPTKTLIEKTYAFDN